MGNCIETCKMRQEEEKGEAKECKEEVGHKKEGGLKVKVVLTRGELEWLMMQLKEKGERKLEDVLMEIEKQRERESSRRDDQGWKPNLESIMEIPEVQVFDDLGQ